MYLNIKKLFCFDLAHDEWNFYGQWLKNKYSSSYCPVSRATVQFLALLSSFSSYCPVSRATVQFLELLSSFLGLLSDFLELLSSFLELLSSLPELLFSFLELLSSFLALLSSGSILGILDSRSRNLHSSARNDMYGPNILEKIYGFERRIILV